MVQHCHIRMKTAFTFNTCLRALSIPLMLLLASCSRSGSPAQPSSGSPSSPAVLALEGEHGSGDGFLLQRSRASGGQTVHLAPGEARRWTVVLNATQADYALAVTYSNSRWGDREVLTVTIDGTVTGTQQVRDSGEGEDAWNTFVTDPAGGSALGRGSHIIVISSSGGDGCVEIDKVTLTPAGGVERGE